MPFTLKQLGDVSVKTVLDLGCGEGGYSRELARKGALVSAIDCAENAIKHCVSKAEEEQLKISYHVRNSSELYDFVDNTFDLVLASMMLMDCEDFEGTVKEISRVLKPSGKLFASVCSALKILKTLDSTFGEEIIIYLDRIIIKKGELEL